MPRILAVDYGTRRTGTALSDPTGSIASPLCTVETRGPRQLARDLAELAREHQVEELVLGLPLDESGAPGEHVPAVEDLARRLRGRLHLPLHLVDERYTSALAERALLEGGARRQERRQVVDQVAAAVLLQGFLDRRSASDGQPEVDLP